MRAATVSEKGPAVAGEARAVNDTAIRYAAACARSIRCLVTAPRAASGSTASITAAAVSSSTAIDARPLQCLR
jgi:hypothetical protein